MLQISVSFEEALRIRHVTFIKISVSFEEPLAQIELPRAAGRGSFGSGGLGIVPMTNHLSNGNGTGHGAPRRDPDDGYTRSVW